MRTGQPPELHGGNPEQGLPVPVLARPGLRGTCTVRYVSPFGVNPEPRFSSPLRKKGDTYRFGRSGTCPLILSPALPRAALSIKGRAFGSSLARGSFTRTSTAEADRGCPPRPPAANRARGERSGVRRGEGRLGRRDVVGVEMEAAVQADDDELKLAVPLLETDMNDSPG